MACAGSRRPTRRHVLVQRRPEAGERDWLTVRRCTRLGDRARRARRRATPAAGRAGGRRRRPGDRRPPDVRDAGAGSAARVSPSVRRCATSAVSSSVLSPTGTARSPSSARCSTRASPPGPRWSGARAWMRNGARCPRRRRSSSMRSCGAASRSTSTARFSWTAGCSASRTSGCSAAGWARRWTAPSTTGVGRAPRRDAAPRPALHRRRAAARAHHPGAVPGRSPSVRRRADAVPRLVTAASRPGWAPSEWAAAAVHAGPSHDHRNRRTQIPAKLCTATPMIMGEGRRSRPGRGKRRSDPHPLGPQHRRRGADPKQYRSSPAPRYDQVGAPREPHGPAGQRHPAEPAHRPRLGPRLGRAAARGGPARAVLSVG